MLFRISDCTEGRGLMDDPAGKPRSVTGAEAKRVKREALGIADSSRPRSRPAGPESVA
ncbi:hypothetical protein OKJ48_02100 [Streptomyces kunmingensis]|uniref:Uncharacterized protein n=1 Tax=Streptomyces kunmingensis TaxID=68225 RepID=A0ABU6C403_9ACTN|nr:hypothetical protein [Streptomyces kunmingensis]MEB3959055.1 hypothetical protein [Streptomyces kunmingensis]